MLHDAYKIEIDFIGHYIVTDTVTGRDIYLQGDDARNFRQELDAIDHTARGEQQRQTLIGNLCSEYFT